MNLEHVDFDGFIPVLEAFFLSQFPILFLLKNQPFENPIPLALKTDTIIKKSVRLVSDTWGRLLTLLSFLTEYSSCQVVSALGLISCRSPSNAASISINFLS